MPTSACSVAPPDITGNVDALKLGTETITPVCSASYAQKHGLNTLDDLYRVTLLCGDLPEDWAAWFEVAGGKQPPPFGPRLGDDGAILQAAIDGQGVALGRSRLVAEDVALGRLIVPFAVSLDASHAYWFVRPKDIPATRAVHSMREWLADHFDEQH